MGGFGALLITLSGLSPSIGVFIVGSDVMHQAGSSTLLCFAAAALLGVAIANVYAELSAAFPETGGEYTIVGRALGPAWGFAMLGLNLLTFSIAPAMTGLGVATYLQVVWPSLPAIPTAMVAVTLCMGTAILNVKTNAWVTGGFLSIELISLAVVAWLGLHHPQPDAMARIVQPVLLAHGRLVTVSLAGLGIGAAAAIYAFDGYGSVVYLGEEIKDAPSRIARVVFWALGLAVVWQLTPLLAVLIGAPQLTTLFAADSPVQAFIAAAGGPILAKVMSFGVALALFNAMIASALMGGRQLYSSGRDRAWGRMSQAFARLHPRFNSPWIATLTVGAVSLLLCLVKLNVLVILIGDGTAGLYICMCLAALAGRRSGVTAHAAYRMPLFPLLPWLALTGLFAVGVADLFDADGRKGVAASAIVVVLSALYYRLVLKPGGGWAHRGPQKTLKI